MILKDRFLLCIIVIVCCIFPKIYLCAQNKTFFRSEQPEKQHSKEEFLPANPFSTLEENMAKNNKLIRKEEDSDQCLSYQIHCVCTTENMYEIFKNTRIEGLFYSYDDTFHKISTQYKKTMQGEEMHYFNTYIFRSNHTISIQLTSCKENLNSNTVYLAKLQDEFKSYAPHCQTIHKRHN